MELIVAILVAAIAAAAFVSWAVRRLLERVTVFEFERGLRYDKGRFSRVLGPGTYRLVRARSRIFKVDVRPRIVVVPGQEVITSDGVSVRISLTSEFEVADAAVAINDHEDYARALYAALQHALR